jgi:hypothetical protein
VDILNILPLHRALFPEVRSDNLWIASKTKLEKTRFGQRARELFSSPYAMIVINFREESKEAD